MQAAHTGRSDVHARSLTDRLEAFENGDVLCVVTGIAGARAGTLVVRHDPPMTLTRPGPAPGTARRGVRNGVQNYSTGAGRNGVDGDLLLPAKARKTSLRERGVSDPRRRPSAARSLPT